ncbi:MAG TPA: DUF2156 domain-containing protein [Candidatus Caccousia avicola]|uniref:DUF2156 domain-containing protein n=1 Tax=Candidatus Caccousia avicola TaxID=2840721 RepID=A0A9D1DDZ3_9FIRM|nr:DUF2156 domain-containing protein [Candidatus Caccousia avicola]
MLNFYYPELKDRDWVQPILSASGGLGSEHAFGTMYVWRWTYCRRICRYKDFLLSGFGKDLRAYVVPEGTGDLREAVEVLIEDAKERGIPFRLWGVTKERLEEYESLFPGKFDYIPLRDDADYLYRSEDLIQLAGRKLHGKRNHLAQFNRSYQWTYEEVSRENFKDCMAVAHEWCLKHGSCGEDGHSEENCAVAAALHGFEPLGMKGGLIRIEGKPVAFTVGEEINPRCFVIHFEKAVDGYNGLYAAINHEFAANALSGYEYINREEDMGIEGLRKAKLSYQPAILLEKYMAVPKGETL